MKKLFVLYFIASLFPFCNSYAVETKDRVSLLLLDLQNHDSNNVMICAHRGDRRVKPENSLAGLKYCIKKKYDIIEIDLQKTKDGNFIIHHDIKLGRTTTGSGFIKDLTLSQIKNETILDFYGKRTKERIPTLEEFLKNAKGKILVQIDKWNNENLPEILSIIENEGCLNQCIFRSTKRFSEIQRIFGSYLDQIIYIPVVKAENPNAETILQEFIDGMRSMQVVSVMFSNEKLPMVEKLHQLSKKYKVWLNAILEETCCAGHGDKKSAMNPEDGYGWLIKKGASIIFTDDASHLRSYLKTK